MCAFPFKLSVYRLLASSTSLLISSAYLYIICSYKRNDPPNGIVFNVTDGPGRPNLQWTFYKQSRQLLSRSLSCLHNHMYHIVRMNTFEKGHSQIRARYYSAFLSPRLRSFIYSHLPHFNASIISSLYFRFFDFPALLLFDSAFVGSANTLTNSL